MNGTELNPEAVQPIITPIKRIMFSNIDPAITINQEGITFNKAFINTLDETAYIQFLIKTDEKKLLIKPCDAKAIDAIRWCAIKGDKNFKITCVNFTKRLYEIMGWKPIYCYRLQGIEVPHKIGQLYLFDLYSPERFSNKSTKSDLLDEYKSEDMKMEESE